jgi:L-seryl-tRNA(Ser) seleniumtransferase
MKYAGKIMKKNKQQAADGSDNQKNLLKAIPKMDQFLDQAGEELAKDPELASSPYKLLKSAAHEFIDLNRKAILKGELLDKSKLEFKSLWPQFKQHLLNKLEPNLKTVINATGVVVHTNLGRSILPEAAARELSRAACNYSNLEFNLNTGKRGSRYSLVEELLCELTGAEAALVVNNNAAAVLLVLESLASGRQVIVSRGQLVEIGGSFRIPEIMEKSGARLVEVGATNRTHLKDYQKAISQETGMLLKVHTSNYRMVGFTKEVDLSDLVELGAEHGLPVMEDLGSGCLVDLQKIGLSMEPTVQNIVKTGVDVLTFSGDKLLGGPQAGIILGKKAIIEKIKQNQLNRALRIDKFTLSALETVLRMYFDENAWEKIPTLRMLSTPVSEIEKRAQYLLGRIKKPIGENCEANISKTFSRVGGGALPEQDLPSSAVALTPHLISVNSLEKQLRGQRTPIIGKIEDNQFLLDMRTVTDSQTEDIARALVNIFASDL